MSIESILEDVRNGKPIIIVDDKDRENEGDIVIAAEKATIHNLIFAMNHARGLMCIPCDGIILDRLQIKMMPTNSRDKYETPFCVSIDAVEGVATGMSVYDRLKTIAVLIDPNSVPTQLSQPGHLFPLRPRKGLLKERRGHTEASVELLKLAGLQPISIIIEIMDTDGTMLKGEKLHDYTKRFDLKLISIGEIYNEVYNKGL
tara:strand:- start:3583 stop:4188 length:606 start_codon:yes stop_codon:yes gene_type:complete